MTYVYSRSDDVEPRNIIISVDLLLSYVSIKFMIEASIMINLLRDCRNIPNVQLYLNNLYFSSQ